VQGFDVGRLQRTLQALLTWLTISCEVICTDDIYNIIIPNGAWENSNAPIIIQRKILVK